MVIQNISASFSELFPNYVPRPPLPRKVGGHDPQLLWERRPCFSPSDKLHQPFFEFATDNGFIQVVNFTIRRSNLLDIVLIDDVLRILEV